MPILSVSDEEFEKTRCSPEDFIDGHVTAREKGYVWFLSLDSQEFYLRVFEAPVDAGEFLEGEPVSYHPSGVLANGSLWVSARVVIVKESETN